MREMISGLSGRIPPLFDSTVGHLILALGVLVAVGGLALVTVALLRRLLRSLGLHDQVVDRVRGVVRVVLGEERASRVNVDVLAGRILFLGLLILVVAVFASFVDFDRLGGPGGALLGGVMGIVWQMGQALVLLLVSWFIAGLLRRAARGVLDLVGLDSVPREADDPAPRRMAQALPEVVYWTVLLLFLPPVLEVLELDGVLAPVEAIANQVLLFLPNLFGAVIIFVVGWLLARLAKAMVTNLLVAVGLDRMAARFRIQWAFGTRTPSSLVGTAAYVLVLLPVILAGLDRLSLEEITGPVSDMLIKLLAAIPVLLVAVALLGTAYVVGRIVANLVRDLLHEAGFDQVLTRLGLTSVAPAGEEYAASNIVRILIVAVIMLFASIEAASLLGFDNVAQLLVRLVEFAGQFLLGVVFVGFGILLANLSVKAIRASSMAHRELLAAAARIGILLFATAIGLRQMGIAGEIIEIAFGIVLGSVAVAFAVAFGLGGREAAARQIEQWREELSRRRRGGPSGP